MSSAIVKYSPKAKQDQGTARCIEQDVPDTSLARGDESLVKFIARCAECDQRENEAGF